MLWECKEEDIVNLKLVAVCNKTFNFPLFTNGHLSQLILTSCLLKYYFIQSVSHCSRADIVIRGNIMAVYCCLPKSYFVNIFYLFFYRSMHLYISESYFVCVVSLTHNNSGCSILIWHDINILSLTVYTECHSN